MMIFFEKRGHILAGIIAIVTGVAFLYWMMF